MRKTYDKAFEAKVALDAFRGEKTIQELGQIHEVHPQLITTWKKQLSNNATELFERPGKVSEEEQAAERERDKMLRQLGEMTIENQFLKNSTNSCTGTSPSCRPRGSWFVGQPSVPNHGGQPVVGLLPTEAPARPG